MAKLKSWWFILMLCLACDALAEMTPSPLADASKKASAKAGPLVDKETESKALELVRAHLPELQEMLKRLRSQEPRQYDRAVRDLARSARRLEGAKSRDERLFDIEVKLLKAQSQVNLLTAKLKVRDSQPDRRRLRASLKRLNQLKIVRAQYDVKVFQERLERTEKLLDEAQERLATALHDDTDLENTYLGLLDKAGRQPTESSPE